MIRKGIIVALCFILLSGCKRESAYPLITEATKYKLFNSPSIENQNEILDPPVIKIVIQEAGIYQVTAEEIHDLTSGVGVFQNAELFHRGKPYPTWVEENNQHSVLRFFAPEPDSPYTSSGIYWLYFRSSPVTRLGGEALRETDPTRIPNIVTIESKFEEDLIYEPSSPEFVPWFWSKIPTGGKTKVELNLLPDRLIGSRLLLRVWAKSEGQIYPNDLYPHAIELSAGETSLGEFQWIGSGFHEIEFELSDTLLSVTEIQLTLQSRALVPDANDVVWLDRITVFSDVPLDSLKTPATIRRSGGGVFGILDFHQTVLALHGGVPIGVFHPKNPINSKQVVAYPKISGDEFLLFADKDVHAPDILEVVDFGKSGLVLDQGANFLILGPERYADAALTLINWRIGQGYRAQFVAIEKIIRDFGFGYPEPDAIRKFIQEIQSRNMSDPLYVLLLGDFSYSRDPVSMEVGISFVPSELIYTEQGGWTVSDTSLVDFDHNGIPDLPIGRIPARDKTQVETVIRKIINYEKSLQSQPLGILPIIDPIDQAILHAADHFLEKTEVGGNLKRINVYPSVMSQESLHKMMESYQISMLVFFGHGSLSQLGNPTILDDKLSNFTSNDYILVAFSCLAGYFAHPEQSSLVEENLVNDNGGFVAAISPTSLAIIENQGALASSFASHISGTPNARLGDIFINSLEDAWLDTTNIDLLRTFLILGDPAMLVSR